MCFGDTGLYLNNVNVKESEEGMGCETTGWRKIEEMERTWRKEGEKRAKGPNLRKRLSLNQMTQYC
jgi:hypothetical protein